MLVWTGNISTSVLLGEHFMAYVFWLLEGCLQCYMGVSDLEIPYLPLHQVMSHS